MKYFFIIILFLSCQQDKKHTLQEIISSNDPDIINKNTINLNEQDLNTLSDDGTTPLTKYLIQNIDYSEAHRKVLINLLENGADPNKKTQMGLSPLFIAVNNNDQTAIELLIDYGANVEEKTFTGESLHELTKKLNNEEVENLLIESL